MIQVSPSCAWQEEKKEWMVDASQHGYEGCILSLLIPALKNLKTLDLEFPRSPLYVKRQLTRIASKEHPFDKNPTLEHLESFMAA